MPHLDPPTGLKFHQNAFHGTKHTFSAGFVRSDANNAYDANHIVILESQTSTKLWTGVITSKTSTKDKDGYQWAIQVLCIHSDVGMVVGNADNPFTAEDVSVTIVSPDPNILPSAPYTAPQVDIQV